jgi:hypothetical protein
VITKYEDVVDDSQGQFGRDVLADSAKRRDTLLRSWGRADDVLREVNFDKYDELESKALKGLDDGGVGDGGWGAVKAMRAKKKAGKGKGGKGRGRGSGASDGGGGARRNSLFKSRYGR